jgi:putative DeoR family transcriptional regulator, stage III sporulation protein D
MEENKAYGVHPLIYCIRPFEQNGEARGVHDYIKDRTLKIGEYIVETRNTVRTIAREFGVSKSTVHKDLTERLPEINPDLANRVKEILEYHKSIRHLRGGEATKLKYNKDEKAQNSSKNFTGRKGVSSGL